MSSPTQSRSGSGQRVSTAEWVDGLRRGDTAVLARAITLIESQHPHDVERAAELVEALQAQEGESHRIGISGVPGVGKSSLIDAVGLLLIEAGHRVAVLAVDPSSSISGGSILGDKSRMPRLAKSPASFIRPSPNDLSPGGVARCTREAIVLCEAAGFDRVVIETVGVGQSETAVASMVDTFLMLLLPGAGDELQGIKKGIVELADIVAVNKADGSNLSAARTAREDYAAALRFLSASSEEKQSPPVLVVSALTGEGLSELVERIEEHGRQIAESGRLREKRGSQRLAWMWSLINSHLVQSFRSDPQVQARLTSIEQSVRDGSLGPEKAARELTDLFAS